MTHTFEFARWATRLRALLVVAFAAAFAACDTDRLTNASDEPAAETAEPVSVTDADFASSFRGGIPIGTFAQPTHTIGSRYNGALRNIWPQYLRQELAGIKARGGRVVLTFVGNERHYKTRGRFDMGKWKARVNRFRNVNFDQYIKDGTIIGHYLIDEPNDRENWGRGAISPSTIEEMAKYSKKLWPNLTTIVRVQPDYLSHRHRYLDVAWAQYVHRKGTAANYIRKNVAEASKRGLGLIVGLNIRKGGPRGRAMTPKEVVEWGTTMLSSSYPCAFISWQYHSGLSSRAMASAMDVLRRRAQSRGTKRCG
jgi:hypothetical protein